MFNVKLLDREPPDTIDNEESLQLIGNDDDVLEPLLSQDSGTEGIIRILPEAAYDIRLGQAYFHYRILDGRDFALENLGRHILSLITHLGEGGVHDPVFLL